METAVVDRIRNALIQAANAHLAEPRLAFCLAAIEEYCAAYRARLQLSDGTITSYSIQGRSITKRNIADIDLDTLYAEVARYLPADVLPKDPDTPRAIGFDFSRLGGLR